jgi:hypothetical protein
MRTVLARLLLVPLALGALAGPAAASRTTPVRAATPVAYTRHLTKIAEGTNTTCGPLKMLIVRAHLQPGHRFHQVHAFYLRLRGGRTVKLPFEAWNVYRHGRVVEWIAHDVGNAKVSHHLRLSHTSFTATPGSVWHAKVSAGCYSM